jgi:hypothetical protein
MERQSILAPIGHRPGSVHRFYGNLQQDAGPHVGCGTMIEVGFEPGWPVGLNTEDARVQQLLGRPAQCGWQFAPESPDPL